MKYKDIKSGHVLFTKCQGTPYEVIGISLNLKRITVKGTNPTVDDVCMNKKRCLAVFKNIK